MKLQLFAIIAVGLLLLGCLGSPAQPPSSQTPAPSSNPQVVPGEAQNGVDEMVVSNEQTQTNVCNYLSNQEVKTGLGLNSEISSETTSSTECVFYYPVEGVKFPTLSVKVDAASELPAEALATLKGYIQQAGATIEGENELGQGSLRYNVAESQCSLVAYKGSKMLTLIFLNPSTADGKCDSSKLKGVAQIILGKI